MNPNLTGILDSTAKWIEASSNPQNADSRLIIERVGFIKEGETLTQVRFQVKSEVFLGQINLPIAVVQPAPAVLVAPDGSPATPTP